ncbi:MAG: proton-conducting transporter membrane subunit [Moorellales bacterium]
MTDVFGLGIHAPILVVAVPLLAAFATPLVTYLGETARKFWLILAVTLTFLTVLVLVSRVLSLGTQVYTFGAASPFIPLPSGLRFPVRIIFEVDALSAFMSLSASLVALATAVYSLRFMEGSDGLDKFTTLFLLMLAGMLGMELTGDAFNFFVFLEISSIAAAALVAFWRQEPEPVEAGFKYLLLGTVGALLVLIAVALLYGRYDALNFASLAAQMQVGLVEKLALALLVAALALKAGAVPLHFVTPDAYSRAPAVVTAILVSVSQASLYGLFRIAFSLYGLNLPSPALLGWVIIVLGLLSMFVGVTMALPQHDIKRLMAYHAVSQTGYMLLGVGVGLAVLSDPVAFRDYGLKAMEGGIFHIINHALYKGLLFLTAGALFYRTGTDDLNAMGGLGHRLRFTTVCFIIGAAAIAGLPGFNGFASKLLIYESVYRFNPVLAVIAMVVSILTLASFVKVFQAAFLGPPLPAYREVEEVPAAMRLGMGFLAGVVVFFGLFPQLIVNTLVSPAAQALAHQALYIAQVMGGR